MSGIEYATWLLDHLSEIVHQALFEHLLDCDRLAPQDRKEEIRGFVIGCTGRIEDRLIEICNRSNTARTVNGNALVVMKDRAIDDFMKCNGISPKIVAAVAPPLARVHAPRVKVLAIGQTLPGRCPEQVRC